MGETLLWKRGGDIQTGRVMGEQLEHMWDHKEQSSLRHILMMLTYTRDRIKKLFRGRGLPFWDNDHSGVTPEAQGYLSQN